MKRFLAAFFALTLLLSPAWAQKSKSQMNSDINTNFPDNTAGLITPLLLRNTTAEFVNNLGLPEIDNCGLTASVASNLLTVTLTDAAGNTPSTASPCNITFRSATATTGITTTDQVIGATSINTFATGATLGSSNNFAFRFWVVAFDNAGSVVLSLYNASAAFQSCAPINESVVQSSTGITGGATSTGVFYTPNGVTLASKAIKILGFIEYNSTGLVTAGTYATAPNFVQRFGPGTKRPCETVQIINGKTATNFTTTSNVFANSNLNAIITPTSAANLIQIMANGSADSGATNITVNIRVVRAAGPVISGNGLVGASSRIIANQTKLGIDSPNTLTAQTYTVQISNSDNATTVGFAGELMTLTEIMG